MCACLCVHACARVCVRVLVCVCVCVCVRISLCNLQAVILGTLTTVMPIAQQGLDGLASRPDPCVPNGLQKTKASKTKKK